MPARRSTWGCNQDAGGGYRRLRYWADLGDGRGYRRVSETVRGSRRDGDEVLAQRRLEHSADRPCPTLAEVWDRWYWPECESRAATGDLAPDTVRMYESAWRNHVEPTFGALPVTDVRPLDVQTWLDGMGAGAARTARAVLRQVLDVAVRYEIVDHNVATARYHMPKGESQSREVLTRAQMADALDAARGTVAYVPAILCGTASCRVGEALGATRQDVSRHVAHGMELAVVRIKGQLGRDGSIRPCKTPQSARPVVVPEPWSADVLAVADGWLCAGPDGRPIDRAQAAWAWRRCLQAAGLPDVTLRNMRASWRTIMRWELGVPEDKVERMMGHAGKTVGQLHYDRPDEEVFCDVVARAWQALTCTPRDPLAGH